MRNIIKQSTKDFCGGFFLRRIEQHSRLWTLCRFSILYWADEWSSSITSNLWLLLDFINALLTRYMKFLDFWANINHTTGSHKVFSLRSPTDGQLLFSEYVVCNCFWFFFLAENLKLWLQCPICSEKLMILLYGSFWQPHILTDLLKFDRHNGKFSNRLQWSFTLYINTFSGLHSLTFRHMYLKIFHCRCIFLNYFE